MPMPVKFPAEVVNLVRHGDDVVTYEFRCLAARPRYKAGQFLHLALDAYDPSGHWPESRCFTIANGFTRPGQVRLTIACKGAFTRRLIDELQVGRKVWMKAPYGDFIVRTQPECDVVLIGGGTGVTPFVAFMEDSLVQGIHGRVWLHYGARDESLLVFRSTAQQCASQLPGFHCRYYAEHGATGDTQPGRINLGQAVAQATDGRNAIYYLCGPQPMIAAFQKRLLAEFGVPEVNVRIDKWE